MAAAATTCAFASPPFAPPLRLRRRPALPLRAPRVASRAPPVARAAPPPPPPPHCERMFSNVEPDARGVLRRVPPPQLACTCLIAGTMIGAGVLTLPTVSEPVGLLPSSLALVAVWGYMVATALLLSELSVNCACARGRADGVSMLSLAAATLGRRGGAAATALYVLLHYAVLSAYAAQGGAAAFELLRAAGDAARAPLPAAWAGAARAHAAAFGALMGAAVRALPARRLAAANNAMVGAAVAALGGVLLAAARARGGGGGGGGDGVAARAAHWALVAHGPLLPVLLVSCVFHNVVGQVAMRLEGDARRIRRAVVVGSGVPMLMFVAYDAAVLRGGAAGGGARPLVALFSTLAVATSFVGFADGLSAVCADARQAVAGGARAVTAADVAAAVAPAAAVGALWPHAAVAVLDAAGTWGVAVLFGVLPAAMAWRQRRAARTARMRRALRGGDALLAALALPPLALIASHLWP